MQTRVATLADLDLLVEIGPRTFFDTFVGTCSDEDMQAFLAESYAPARLRAEIDAPQSHFLILEDSTGALGYSRLLGQDIDTVELVRFYMEQPAIGTGAAHELMRATLDLAIRLGYKRVILGVWEKNFRAQRFYSKWGFEKTGEKVFMVGSDAQTDWCFERNL